MGPVPRHRLDLLHVLKAQRATLAYGLAGFPCQAKFPKECEHAILIARLQADGALGYAEPFSWHGNCVQGPARSRLRFLFHAHAFALDSLSLFLPTLIALSLFFPPLIAQLGCASWTMQLVTISVYACAFFSNLFFAWLSHKCKQRGSFIFVAGANAIVGCIVLLTKCTAGSQYAGAIIPVISIYYANALLLFWPSENVSPQTKRDVTLGMQIFAGDIAAFVGVPRLTGPRRPTSAASHTASLSSARRSA
ncbi:MFS transporter [Rhodotorula toruloides]|uniref:MFS transporter n=1 Tax=Rhodotorula toruloides TaxID=5286 RepID=A0A511KQJ2_RHOTO|nr:MFS transporter [Rhodotorula toruloides]